MEVPQITDEVLTCLKFRAWVALQVQLRRVQWELDPNNQQRVLSRGEGLRAVGEELHEKALKVWLGVIQKHNRKTRKAAKRAWENNWLEVRTAPGVELPVITRTVKTGGRKAQRAANQALYVEKAFVKLYANQGKPRATADRGFGSRCMLEVCTNLAMPALRFENDCPPEVMLGKAKASGKGEKRTFRVSKSQWRRCAKAWAKSGRIVSAKKWLMSNEAVQVLAKTFPMAVDFNAYASSLCAPIIANGLWKGVEGQPLFYYSHLGNGRDGSGLIHTKHPLIKAIFGDSIPSAVQIRIWDPESGTFIKGILVPSDLALDPEGRPTIIVDWEQVKGSQKTEAQKAIKGKVCMKPAEGNFTLGVIQTWKDPGPVKVSFPWLERITDGSENRKKVSGFIKKSIEGFQDKGGLLGLVENAVQRNLQLELYKELACAAGESPLVIPQIQEAVNKDLQRYLWQLRQGAGMVAHQATIVMDDRVPRGHCILSPKRDEQNQLLNWIGKEIAAGRFPMLLPNGLQVWKQYQATSPWTIKWEKKDGTVVQVLPSNLVIINPADAKQMQADDDGDIAMIFFGRKVIEAHRSRIVLFEEGEEFSIEPKKDATGNWTKDKKGRETPPKDLVETLWVFEKGERSKWALDILSQDGMGPVGLMTYWTSVFLAQNKYLEALACAVLVQYCIDAGKRVVNWPDPAKLAKKQNWFKGKDNCWRFRNCDTGTSGLFPEKQIRKWCRKRAGFKKEYEGLNTTLTWREGRIANAQGTGKSLTLESFLNPEPSPRRGINLVHFSAHEAPRLWRAMGGMTLPPPMSQKEMKGLLRKLLVEKGVNLKKKGRYASINPSQFAEELGLRRFGLKVRAILQKESLQGPKRNQLIEHAERTLASELGEFSISKLVGFWEVCWQEAKANPADRLRWIKRAYRAVAFRGSPVLEALGITQPEQCRWAMKRKKKLRTQVWRHIIGSGLFQKNPEVSPSFKDVFAATSSWEFVRTVLGHPKTVDNGVCEDCMNAIQADALAAARDTRFDTTRHAGTEMIGRLISTFNHKHYK